MLVAFGDDNSLKPGLRPPKGLSKFHRPRSEQPGGCAVIRLAPEESLHRLNNRQLKLMIERGFFLSFYANLKLYNELALSKNKSNKNMSMFVWLPFAFTRSP